VKFCQASGLYYLHSFMKLLEIMQFDWTILEWIWLEFLNTMTLRIIPWWFLNMFMLLTNHNTVLNLIEWIKILCGFANFYEKRKFYYSGTLTIHNLFALKHRKAWWLYNRPVQSFFWSSLTFILSCWLKNCTLTILNYMVYNWERNVQQVPTTLTAAQLAWPRVTINLSCETVASGKILLTDQRSTIWIGLKVVCLLPTKMCRWFCIYSPIFSHNLPKWTAPKIFPDICQQTSPLY
jgi:hypothetical protein